MEKKFALELTAHEIRMIRIALITRSGELDDAGKSDQAAEYGELYDKIRKETRAFTIEAEKNKRAGA